MMTGFLHPMAYTDVNKDQHLTPLKIYLPHRYRKPTRKTLSTLEYHKEQETRFGGQFDDNISVHRGLDDIPAPPSPSSALSRYVQGENTFEKHNIGFPKYIKRGRLVDFTLSCISCQVPVSIFGIYDTGSLYLVW